jgi:hypothetical protein
VCTGIADKVDLISVSLPLLCIKLPFQAGRLSATLSIGYCQVDLGSLDVDDTREEIGCKIDLEFLTPYECNLTLAQVAPQS